MNLCVQLCDILSNSTHLYNIIQITGHSEEDSAFFCGESDPDTLEIGLTKKTYLKLFKQSHTYWHVKLGGKHPTPKCIKQLKEEDLWELYYMTLGFLITTNENHTIIKLHEEVVFLLRRQEGVQFLQQEFNILTSFATSRLKRINKSSSLWFFIKKLFILLIASHVETSGFPTELYGRLLRRVLKSCDLHFANYYASNFLGWCIKVNFLCLYQNKDREVSEAAISSLKSLNNVVFDHILLTCHQNLQDPSKWRLLQQIIMDLVQLTSSSQKLLFDYEFVIEEYNDISVALNSSYNQEIKHLQAPAKYLSTKNLWPIDDASSFLTGQLRWLLGVGCPYRYPYDTLLQLFKYNVVGTGGLIDPGISADFDSILNEKKEKIASVEDPTSSAISKEIAHVECLQFIISKYFI